jgi:hypothetical protein
VKCKQALPLNGLELGCPAEAGCSPLLCGTLPGLASSNQDPARRLSFSELLGSQLHKAEDGLIRFTPSKVLGFRDARQAGADLSLGI